jgi:hypothetical protein
MTPTPADAAWDELYVSILHAEGDGQSIKRRLARHRPLIEAALAPPPAEPTLSVCPNCGSINDIPPAEPTLDVERLARAEEWWDLEGWKTYPDDQIWLPGANRGDVEVENYALRAAAIAAEYARLTTEDPKP